MKSIVFFDTEIEPQSGKILDIGCCKNDGSQFHKASLPDFLVFVKGTDFIVGHNILAHDLKYIGPAMSNAGIPIHNAIDTLLLSPLLFPNKPYHGLIKDDKLQQDGPNNPLSDSINAKAVFDDEVAAFNRLEEAQRQIFYGLLGGQNGLGAFFRYLDYTGTVEDVATLIAHYYHAQICEQAPVAALVAAHPIELAYCLSLVKAADRYSITPPWVLKNYPKVDNIMRQLLSQPCLSGCRYCLAALDVRKGLKRYFGFDAFRSYGGQPLQEQAAQAAIDNHSLLAVFPTGGGKSITFQVPALMSGEHTKGLTVVISPLQSLMKDQVDNLEKAGITDAVTINGLLDPIERAKSMERVEDGRARILYISPESLRSPSIERLLLGRKILRFVIDEAHCFSAWGQDFRVDYLYIADFILMLQKKKNLQEPIPVSCFTATAKQRVIADIQQYFKEKLSLSLRLFTAKATRNNLNYQVFETDDDEAKYQAARNLIEAHPCPTIIYVSRTKTTLALAERLTKDGFEARPYNGKMDVEEKTANQDAFMSGQVPIIVATSAFGMGVDKKDVGMVIHYEISDSLENYVQEAGRAGRDEQMKADCFVLFNEEDLSKHFILLNQTKLSIKEIQQVWKAVKDSTTKFRSKISSSALEIARKAGWDENIREIETRVTTAIAALEEAGYLKRGQNMPRVYANSILSKTADEAIAKIVASQKINAAQQDNAIRIIKKLFASKRRKQVSEETAEARVDYISDHLGIIKEEVLNIINLLREEKILADMKDLTAFIKKGDSSNRSLGVVESFGKIEQHLLTFLQEEEKTLSLKDLNEAAIANGCSDSNVSKLKTILNFWAIKHWVKRQSVGYTRSHVQVLPLIKIDDLQQRAQKRLELAGFITQLLYEKSRSLPPTTTTEKEEVLVEFSVHELKAAYNDSPSLFKKEVGIDDIEDTLFYLSRIGAIVIEGGFLVIYNRLTLERTEQDNYKRYTKDDYSKLNQFYESKVQQIHIVGEYARKMMNDYQSALQFIEDYFQMEYPFFLRKYFSGSRINELKLKMTPAKFKQLFGELSLTQLNIIKDNEAQYIAVLAGPGSGKTKLLVHKLASLLLMEDVKHEQLLMITFSRAAVNEFKKRLVALIGSAANYVEIKTFHAYCFDLLGQKGSLEKSEGVIKMATEKMRNKEVEMSRITKTVLVIDEAQDMNPTEFDLVKTLMEQNEEMRVIAVGDDDQNIYEFRGSDSRYLKQFIAQNKAIQYELLENYRSKHNLVELANQWAVKIGHRLKNTPIFAHQTTNGAIKIVRYRHPHLIAPLVADLIAQAPSGSTCILTTTNDEAAYTTGLLLKKDLKATLIQSNEGFDLYDLVELRFFVDCLKRTDNQAVIDDELWDKAKQQLAQQFRSSKLLGLCQQVIKEFEATQAKKKYHSDLTVFLHEAQMEDFYDEAHEMIFVSTIHKAKGKEFDNVYLLLDCFTPDTDEKKRLLYVGITRAKQNLTIHYNGNYLAGLSAENLTKLKDESIYSLPNEITVHLTLRDVWLSFQNNQTAVAKLISGDGLQVDTEGCYTMEGKPVLKFSKNFKTMLTTKLEKGYRLTSAKVNFVVYWNDKKMDKELRIVLPALVLGQHM